MSGEFESGLQEPEMTKELENAKKWTGKEFYEVSRNGHTITRRKYGEFDGSELLKVLYWFKGDYSSPYPVPEGFYDAGYFQNPGVSGEILDENEAKIETERRKENTEKILRPLVGKTVYTLYKDGFFLKSKVNYENGSFTLDNANGAFFVDPETSEVGINRYIPISDETGQEDDNTEIDFSLDSWADDGSFNTYDEEKFKQQLQKIKKKSKGKKVREK